MPELGFKFWSTNIEYISTTIETSYQRGLFNYIELFVVPGSTAKCLDRWKAIEIPYILHAPHSYTSFNLSIKECESKNASLLEEVEAFRVALNPKMIIFHPGINGSIDETIRQIFLFKKDYKKLFELSVIENKPRIGLKGEVCLGSSPEEIWRITNECKMGFCLDIGHAVYFAKWADLRYKDVIKKFITMNPIVCHLSDGDTDSVVDMHLQLGKGNIDLPWICQQIPTNCHITIETNKNAATALDDFANDVAYLKGFLKCQ